MLVGDLVAKGPDSAAVVALARERGALAVMGNHDAGCCASATSSRARTTDDHELKPEQQRCWTR